MNTSAWNKLSDTEILCLYIQQVEWSLFWAHQHYVGGDSCLFDAVVEARRALETGLVTKKFITAKNNVFILYRKAGVG